MNIPTLPAGATRLLGRALLLAKKTSPTTLTYIGIAGGVTATVLASKATLELEPLLNDIAFDAENLKTMEASDSYKRRGLTVIYTKGTLELLKLYGPTLSVGAVSIALIAGSHGIMQQRNAAITAAYVAADKALESYKGRVAAALGADKANELLYPTIEETQEDEDGKKVVVRQSIQSQSSMYAKFFDELNPNWKSDPEYNRLWLTANQNAANDLLIARGHVFLNDVYDSLGIDRTSAGAVVGWIYKGNGDGFIDFGFMDGTKEMVREFINGHESAILLDFNPDGVIYNLI